MRLQTLESIFNVDGKDMIVLPFKSYLLNIMDLHPEDRQHVDQIPGYLNYLDACTKQGFGYTVLDKGRPIVCFGIVPQWPGVAELWLIPDRKLIQKWRLKFHKGAKKFIVSSPCKNAYKTIDVEYKFSPFYSYYILNNLIDIILKYDESERTILNEYFDTFKTTNNNNFFAKTI